MRVQETISIRAAVDRSWDALVDMESRPRWSERVKEARILGQGPLRQGSRIHLQVDKDRFTPVVVEMRPKERLALEVRGPGFKAIHTYALTSEGEGTAITLTGQYGGLLGGLFGRLMGKSVRRDLRDELKAIKRAAESSQEP